jgi:hypothetical protein
MLDLSSFLAILSEVTMVDYALKEPDERTQEGNA